MTPFQAIKATLYMWLAKAREPIQERAVERTVDALPSRMRNAPNPRTPKAATLRHRSVSSVDSVRVWAMFRAGSRVPMQSGSDRATGGPPERRV